MLDTTGDESQQPLIVDDDDDATILPEVTQREANRLIWLLTLTAGLSGLLFGYE
jgi:SP family myo-inositol transporter-like MFS transporter 13